jgi:hypothetical protein
MAKIGKNHFLPHSITSMYKEIKCIFEIGDPAIPKWNLAVILPIAYPLATSLSPNHCWWVLIGDGIAGLPPSPPLLVEVFNF